MLGAVGSPSGENMVSESPSIPGSRSRQRISSRACKSVDERRDRGSKRGALTGFYFESEIDAIAVS